MNKRANLSTLHLLFKSFSSVVTQILLFILLIHLPTYRTDLVLRFSVGRPCRLYLSLVLVPYLPGRQAGGDVTRMYDD